MCLDGAVVALTEEAAGWQGFEPFYFNDEYFVAEFSAFSDNI